MAASRSGVRFLHLNLLMNLFFTILHCNTNSEQLHRVNVILIGATGDLAKRYLWQAMFDLYMSVKKADRAVSVHFYGAARSFDKKDGDRALQDIIKTSVKCAHYDCEDDKNDFSKISTYWKLKSEEDYVALQKYLENNLKGNVVETGRIFYLSVPPFSYAQINQLISKQCRPLSGNAWLRVILEKPFGTDLDSAQELDAKISKYLAEEEVYRIDHYLGKTGVRQIAQFRKANRQTLEPIWNNNFVEKVEIVVKEKRDVRGRMKFYDHYGVIRDMFQNHLTEILVLVTAELSHDKQSDVGITSLEKSRLLQSLRIVTPDNVLFGQYDQYNSQLHHEITTRTTDSNTATFAAVSMFIDNPRWSEVPFVMISGKGLDTRLGYVRVTFKRKKFCIGDPKNCQPLPEIVFYIQGETLEHPVTIIPQGLPHINLPTGWEKISMNNFSISHLVASPPEVVMKPPLSYNAYSMLLQDVFNGDKDMFVDIEDLLLSWKVWTPLLDTSATISPKLYTVDNVHTLDFEFVQGKMKFSYDKNTDFAEFKSSYFKEYKSHGGVRLSSFRGDRLVSGPHVSVVSMLAHDMKLAALSKVKSGAQFHLALSGGISPLLLFQVLAFNIDGFPWQDTHIWLVDERCVPLSHDQSNFNHIYKSLLKHLNIPFLNIHPMPVDKVGKLCDKEDHMDKEYEELLKYYLNGFLDFVVLGVGQDGHTASLFPNQSSTNSSRWVKFTRDSSNMSRMSLTLDVLNKSKNIGVLVQGGSKREIVKELLTGVVDVDRLPITGVNAQHGSLSWYIDDKALEEG